LLKVSTIPFPDKLGLKFLNGLDEVLVVEELDPVIEDGLVQLCGLHGLNVKIYGKRSGHIQNAGENSPDSVAKAVSEYLHKQSDNALVINPDRLSSEDNSMCIQPQNVLNTGLINQAQSHSAFCDTRQSEVNQADEHEPQYKSSTNVLNGENTASAPPRLPVRPPVLCAGCPHRASFLAVKDAAKGKPAVFSGDIGCYTLGNAMPLDMVDTCLCMGAGITVAQGLQRIEPSAAHFAFIGDSTFFHSGITGIINAVYNQTDIIVVILDNSTTAMTGNQPHPGTGVTMMGTRHEKISIANIVKAIGVKAFYRADPFDRNAALSAVKDAMSQKGVKVILFESPCIALLKGSDRSSCEVDTGKCTGCALCVRKLGCPAISFESKKAVINAGLCTGCGLCVGVCPVKAIKCAEKEGGSDV
jgi:indolepyruvate ferredoxin oxidoreductase alpha subunit